MFLKICRNLSYTSKNNCHKEILKLMCVLYFFLIFQKRAKRFLTVQAKFSEALRQVKKQQIKLKFWIWGPITVYYNMTCGQILFQKSLHPTVDTETLYNSTYIIYIVL